MIFLGKIVHNEQLFNHKQLPYIFYQNIKEIPKDSQQLPTLISGWKLINTLLPNYSHDILEKELFLKTKCKHFWEFSPTEDIIQYTHGIELFVKKLPYLFINSFEYKNADPIFNSLFTVEDLNNYIPNGGSLYVYKNEMAYYLHDNKIYGMKLAIFDYMSISITTIIETLKEKSSRHFIDDATEYQKYYKQFPEFTYLKRSMVVFLFS